MKRGRHTTLPKAAKKKVTNLEKLSSVNYVILGKSRGKSRSGSTPVNHIRIQRETEGGFKAMIKTSKGMVDLFISVNNKEEFIKEYEG